MSEGEVLLLTFTDLEAPDRGGFLLRDITVGQTHWTDRGLDQHSILLPSIKGYELVIRPDPDHPSLVGLFRRRRDV